MRYFDARIIENRALGNGYFVLRLGGCDSLAQSRPGQFIMLRGDWGRDPLLPRPVSLLSVAPEGRADLLAKSVGRGTRLLEGALPGTRVSVLGPLGNGFPDPTPDSVDLLVAGGVGMPPLFMQAEHAARRGLVGRCEMIYGGRTSRDLVLLGEMRGMGLATCLATEDGSVGRRGRVTSALEARIDYHRTANRQRKAAHFCLRTARDAVGCGANRGAARDRMLPLHGGADGVRDWRVSGVRDSGPLAAISLRVQRRACVHGLGPDYPDCAPVMWRKGQV